MDNKGGRWGIDTYAEMMLRTGVNRAQNEGRIRGYDAHGVELVHCSQHIGADAHCQPFQNKILAVKGEAGSRRMVDSATGRETTVHVYATLRDAVQRGLLHVNCRHTLTAYTPGVPLPDDIATGDEEYLAEQEQRHNERMIRQWKRMEAAAMTPERVKEARRRVVMWQARQRELVGKHEWMVRRYDRERLWKGGDKSPVQAPREGLITGRDMKRGQLKPVREALKEFRNPKWDERNAPKAFRLYGESLSDLRVDTRNLLEHITYGVRDTPPRRTGGHLYGVVPAKGKKTWFRKEDGPREILALLGATLADPDFMVGQGVRGDRRGAAKWIGGNLYRADWYESGDGQRFLSFFPVCGRDILEVDANGRLRHKASPDEQDKKGWKEV